jgi:hypothetical protein
MRTPVQPSRPRRAARTAHRVPRVTATSRSIARPSISPDLAVTPVAEFQTDPYVDYSRRLTPEGGVLFRYKDIDTRLRYTLWRIFAWTASTGAAGNHVVHYSPVDTPWINVACMMALAIVNWFIVAKPVEIYRLAEIRPDCMILEGSDVFWLALMENGLPRFGQDNDGNQILYGVYGTRFVEYVTLRRFDDYDGMPEVFAAHMKAAMQQLWATALATGSVHPGSPRRWGKSSGWRDMAPARCMIRS